MGEWQDQLIKIGWSSPFLVTFVYYISISLRIDILKL